MDSFLAHGECEHCGFVGDMMFARRVVERPSPPWEMIVEAACEECGCLTNINDMAECPGGRPFIRRLTTEDKYGRKS